MIKNPVECVPAYCSALDVAPEKGLPIQLAYDALLPPVSLMLPVPVNLVVQLVFAVICLRRALFHGWRTPRVQ